MGIHSSCKTTSFFLSGFFLSVVLLNSPLNAAEDTREDTIAACAEAARLLEENDIDGALDEAQWCREGIQQIKQSQTLAVFPDSVNGYEGGEITNSSVLGMVILGRDYKNDAREISIELTTGEVPGLGSLGQLMNAFSAAGLGDVNKFRIQRRTVIDSSTNQSANLSVQLKSGGIMKVESTSVSAEDVIEFLKAFPIADLDDAIGE